MRRSVLRLWLGFTFVLCACEHSPPAAIQPVPQPAPASLSPAAREQLRGQIDIDAMDRLLTTLAPEDGARFLRNFDDVEWAASGRTDVETRDVTITIRFGDAERQRLLEHIWAPFWSQLPPALLSDDSYPLPGRTLAVSRRADSASAARKEREP